MKISYNEISKTYDNYRSYPENLIQKIIEYGKINEGMRVLDLGCGTGNISYELQKMNNLDIIGIDKSKQMLTTARKKSLNVICGNIDINLPIRDNSFDVIIGAYVIHQLKNLKVLVSDCYRILKNGILVFLTASHKQIENQHPVIKEFFPGYIEIDKNRFPDIPKIKYLLKYVGFIDIKHQELLVRKIRINEEYLKKVKNKYVSTYHLLPKKEFENGVEKLEKYIKIRKKPEFREWKTTLIYCKKNK